MLSADEPPFISFSCLKLANLIIENEMVRSTHTHTPTHPYACTCSHSLTSTHIERETKVNKGVSMKARIEEYSLTGVRERVCEKEHKRYNVW